MGKFLATLMILCLTFSIYNVPLTYAQSQRGPRSDYLDIIFFASPESCYNALKAGEIDVMSWPVSDWMFEDATEDPNILLTPLTSTYMMYGFNFNVNETINTYEGVDSPLNNETFRKALAFLIDKDYIVSYIFDGRAERIDVPLPAAQSEWWNTSVSYPNYPYEYNPAKAEQLLDGKDFVDRDGDGIRNYPINWEGREDGPNLDPIIFYVDSTDNVRVSIAENLECTMEAVGIPVDLRKLPPFLMYNEIMINHDYHIYLGSQLVNSLPVYLCILALFVFTYASFGPQLTYPNLRDYWPHMLEKIVDVGLEGLYAKLWRALSWEDALQYAKLVQGVYTEHCFEVPICSIKSCFAYRKNIAGIVNEEGYGIDNIYSFLNAYRTDAPEQPIRVGIVREPMMLNILYSNYLHDYLCLDKIYAGLISYNPYNKTMVQPWVAQDWEISTWVDPEDGKTKTVVDYYFRKNVYWIKPVTGDIDGQFTAKDYEFTCHYIYAQYPFVPGTGIGCPHLDKFEDIHHVEIIDDFHVRVYMNIQSMWAYLWPTYPLLPKHVWLREPLAHNESAYFEINNNITLPGKIPLDNYVVSGSEDTKAKVELINGTQKWLRWGTDLIWKRGDLYIETNSLDGARINKVWVYYWRSGDSRGYYPGGLPWQEILEGCGTHYVVNIDRYSYFRCNANRHFFLETPPLGEIDWRWYWEGTKPRSGHFEINLYDVVKATASYCHYGNGTPDQEWFPGADIDPTDVGHVCIYDIIIVCNNYGKKFGMPPP